MGSNIGHRIGARGLDAGLVAIACVLFIPGAFLTAADLFPLPPQVDFAAYYLAAQALLRGVNPYDQDVIARLGEHAGIAAYTPYIYPPLLAAAIQPLAVLPYEMAAAIWLAISAGALVLSLVLLRALVSIPDRVFPFAVAAALILPPVHHTLELGQINHILLLLITWAAVTPTPWASGALIGAAAALKVFPALLGGVLLVRRNLRAVAAAVVAAVVLTAGSAIQGSGARALRDWLSGVVTTITSERLITPNNQSLEAVTRRLFAPHTFEAVSLNRRDVTAVRLNPLVNRPGIARIVGGAAAAVILLLTIWALIRSRHAATADAQAARFGLIVAATLILLPVVWDHYYVLLLLPLAVIYGSAERRFGRLALIGVVFLLFHRYWRLTLNTGYAPILSFGLAGVMAVWAAVIGHVSTLKDPGLGQHRKA